MDGASEQLLLEALSELSACLGRSGSVPNTSAGCTELFHAVLLWAAPGKDPGSQKQVPARAAVAAKAFLRLLEAIKPPSRDGHNTAGAGKANDPAGQKSREKKSAQPNNARASGSKSGDSSGVGSLSPQSILACATAPVLLLCGGHIQDKPWTNPHSRALAEQLLQTLLSASDCKSLGDLLKGKKKPDPNFGVFKEALGLLEPRLRKETWESNPDAKVAFSWMLYEVSRPWLTNFLSRVMPPSLLFSDDYDVQNKVLGIICLHHIIKNVPAADLRQFNRSMVLYHALRNHLHTTDVEVIEVALPCILDLFPVLRKPPPAVGSYQKSTESPVDQVMQLVLTHMEMESKIVLRRLYARHLPALQERLGIKVLRHMNRLMRVVLSYLEVYDGPEETARLCILETLQGTMKYAWPRIPSRLALLLQSLLKLIHEVSDDPSRHTQPVREALLHEATECLIILDHCCKGKVKDTLAEISMVCDQPDLKKCIEEVLDST
ncbi:TELO2-interacting protein 2 [Hyperolius riggenbachi]|uniref:TELO2-interacting protein 2 n=1 Tax=Hyperolius riggenbachi TaxID=752182 RepID=UPI0035A3D564